MCRLHKLVGFVLLISTLLVVFSVVYAFADGQPAVDVRPAVDQILGYLGTVMPLLAVGFVSIIMKHFGLGDLAKNKMLHDVVARSVVAGMNQVEGALPSKMEVPVANAVLALALKQAQKEMPQFLAKHSITPDAMLDLALGHLPVIQGAITDEDKAKILAVVKNPVQATPAFPLAPAGAS